MTRSFVAILMLLMTTTPTAFAQDAGEAGTTILQQRDDRIVAVLPNRMIVVAQNLPTTPVVTTQVFVKTGSMFEQEHVGAGLSHFLEHLLSGGTTTSRSEAESNAILGRTGARTNASTSLDKVRYYITSTRPHTREIIGLISDWMQNSVITDTEFARERQVIQREFAMGRGDAGRIFWKLTQRARYQHHPSRFPTIGYIEQFMEITRDEIYDFYKRMYVPNNMVFVVVGDIDPPQVIKQVTELWKDVPTGELPELALPVEPRVTEPREVTGYADIAKPRYRLIWPGVKLTGEHDYALDLLAAVLGRGESSRLVRELRDERRMVDSISVYNYSSPWTEGFFGVDATLANTDMSADLHMQKVHDAARAQIDRVIKEGVTATELDRAKRKVLAGVLLSDQSAGAMANRIAGDIIATGDPDYLMRYAQAVQELTSDDLVAAAEAVLTPDQRIEVKLLPADNEHPVTANNKLPEGAKHTPDDAATEPVELDNQRLVGELRDALSEPGDESEVVRVDEPVMRRLDNGLRVIVAPSTAVPGVSVQLYQLGGLLSDEPGKEGVANATMQMLTKGTTGRTADQIAEAIEDLGASLATASGNNTVYARAGALSEDLPVVMELLADVWLNPSFPEDEWDKLRPRIVSAIERQTDRWSGELSMAFRAAYFGDHPWSRSALGRAEVVKELTVQDLAEYHRTHLSAADAVLAIAGDVDVDDAVALAAQHFAALPPDGQKPFNPPMPNPAQNKQVDQPTAKPVAAGQVGFGPGIKRTSDDYAELRTLARLLNDFPAGWLERALRGEGKGLAYAVWAYNVTGVVPGYFTLAFNAQPGVEDEALAEAMKVIDRVKSQPIPPEELQRAKAAVLTDEYLGKQSNSDRAAEVALDELYGIDATARERFLTEVESITAEQLSDIAKQYLSNPVTVMLRHEAGEAAAE